MPLLMPGSLMRLVLPEEKMLSISLSNTPGRRAILPKLGYRVAVFPLQEITVQNFQMIIGIIIYSTPVLVFLPPNYQHYQ